MRSALDVLAICCVIPSVPVVFCDRMELPDEPSAAGINFILGASEGEINSDAEVQKSALAVLVHCVCAPINKVIFHTIIFAKCNNLLTILFSFCSFVSVATIGCAIWFNQNKSAK